MTIKQLREGTEYTLAYLDDIFDFDYKKPSGIKTSPLGYIVLFSNDTTTNMKEKVL